MLGVAVSKKKDSAASFVMSDWSRLALPGCGGVERRARAVRDGNACAHTSGYYIRYWVTSFSIPEGGWHGLALIFIAAAEQTCRGVRLAELQGVWPGLGLQELYSKL